MVTPDRLLSGVLLFFCALLYKCNSCHHLCREHSKLHHGPELSGRDPLVEEVNCRWFRGVEKCFYVIFTQNPLDRLRCALDVRQNREDLSSVSAPVAAVSGSDECFEF